MVRKYVADPSHILTYEPLQIREDITYVEHPVQVLDKRDQVLRNKTIPLVKVLWKNHSTEEATWKRKDEIREKYPHLFHI